MIKADVNFNICLYFCGMSILIDSSKIIFQPVTVTFLEMHEAKELPVPLSNTHFELLPKPIPVTEYRKYYYGVGEKHFWLDRMVMPDEELFEKINLANVDIFLFYVNKEVAGYIEFVKEEKYAEILYFGLMPAFIGQGYGKYFLQWVIAKAWRYQPEWIQLNTCTLDHPNALDSYMKAGFHQVRKEIHQRRVLV
jgi:GNAT superfamily N-acetyltransferase